MYINSAVFFTIDSSFLAALAGWLAPLSVHYKNQQ
jgi:hypothetical protein